MADSFTSMETTRVPKIEKYTPLLFQLSLRIFVLLEKVHYGRSSP